MLYCPLPTVEPNALSKICSKENPETNPQTTDNAMFCHKFGAPACDKSCGLGFRFGSAFPDHKPLIIKE